MSDSDPAVICLSGGLDSTSLLLHLLAQGRSVYGLSFDYGQKHKLELQRLQGNLGYLRKQGHLIEWKLVDLSSISCLLYSSLTNDDWEVPTGHYESENMKQTVVPNRNAIFASIAFAYALSLSQRLNENVAMCLGVHSGDHAIYPDCRPEFYQAIFHAFEIGNWDADTVSLYLPYLELDKHQILKDALLSVEKLGLVFERVFENTLTSYSPDESGKSTGLTGSDVERILAFDQLGIADPIAYQCEWETVVAQARKLESDFRAAKK